MVKFPLHFFAGLLGARSRVRHTAKSFAVGRPRYDCLAKSTPTGFLEIAFSEEDDHAEWLQTGALPVTAVGFEPTPFRNGALSHRLRPLGQTVLGALQDRYVIQGVPTSSLQLSSQVHWVW